MNGRRGPARHQPSPEGFMVARTARSPDFGTPLAFPVSQWRSEWRAWLEGQVPYRGGPRGLAASKYPIRVVFNCLQR